MATGAETNGLSTGAMAGARVFSHWSGERSLHAPATGTLMATGAGNQWAQHRGRRSDGRFAHHRASMHSIHGRDGRHWGDDARSGFRGRSSFWPASRQ